MKPILKSLLTITALALVFAGPLQAGTIKLGVSSGINSLDPAFHNETPTNSGLYNIYDGLVNMNADLDPVPVLAESWSVIDDTTWEFKLQEGVTFHNGNPFTADDVVFSFGRVKHGEKSGFKGTVSAIERMEKVDDHTVRVITAKPFPILLRKLTYVRIVDKETYEGKSDEEIGKMAVGTGPYKLVKWVKGQSLTLEANENYFRGKPAIDKAVIRPLTNDSTRVAAILSNEVHVIDRVPVRDAERIKGKNDLDFFIQPGLRLIYLQFDHERADSPYISGVKTNPFQDVRVRKAFYYGINEDAIVKFVMGGFAKAAGQYYPKAVFGHDPEITRPAYDPEKAKQLLKEAGYGSGFTVTIDSPNDRYINDEEIAQAIASSLAKIGVTIKVNAIPKATFFPKANDTDSSFNLIGWACADGDGSSFLDGCVHSYDKEKGYGRYNGGRYKNPKVDELIETSSGILDDAERLKVLKKAQRIALVQDQNIIPLHYQVDLYASSQTVQFQPRVDSYMYVYDMSFK